MKVLAVAVLLVCIAAATAGVMRYQKCGGAGEILEVRIDGCQGDVCRMVPGAAYLCEADLVPLGTSPSLSMKVTAFLHGLPIPIVDIVLEDSAVTGGQLYVVRFTITPTTAIQGNQVTVEVEITHTNTSFLEACFSVIVEIVG